MRRRWFFLGATVLFFLGLWALGAKPSELVPNEGGRKLAADFFSAAIKPAFDYEEALPGIERVSFFEKILNSLWLTIRYALVAMSLALVLGIAGGILGSRSWWNHSSRFLETLRIGTRLVATALRSVHELMWALLFLAAVGTSPMAAILALALPYGGTLAKVFSELLDEADTSPAGVLKASGAGGMTSFLVTAAHAFPDLATYALYRLECAVRSSAVLGFVGIPTLGYAISTAYEDGHYRQIWSYLYALLIVVMLFEWAGARARDLLTKGVASQSTGTSLAALWKGRGRSRFLRGLGLLAIGTTAFAWLAEEKWGAQLGFERRMTNLKRFLSELTPQPVQENGNWSEIGSWLESLLVWEGLEALWRTFHLGTVAILLSGAIALVGMIFGARSLSQRTPRGVRVGGGPARKILGFFLRAGSMAGRAMPEFILAFLLLQIFGPTMWALIFSLAIHNGGILLRLGAEVIDNSPGSQSTVILSQGGSREAAFLTGLFPQNMNRLVLFLFYRWETCIREATVLGMLGVASLGALISESRAGLFYDEMILWVALGAGLVFLGDLSSDFVRNKLRQEISSKY